jgi:two-component system phosphate regulon response regulator PhoB
VHDACKRSIAVESLPPPRKILIVEDDSRLRSGLGELLRSNGYEVSAAASGEQAISHLRSEGPTDLIVLDLRMPGMNGWQLRSELRRDRDLAAIPVIVATADWNAEGEARTLGAVCCLKKPFSPKQLIETIRHFAA